MELIIILLLSAIWFIPVIVGRNHRNITAILMLTIFGSWTVIGWIVALVWACTESEPPRRQ